MIIDSISKAKQFLPSLNVTVANTRLNDFFQRAQTWVVENIIGTGIEELLETAVGEGQEDPHAALRELTGRVIAVAAYSDAIPEMDLQLSEAGFVVQNNEKMSPASKERVERLLSSLESRLANDADALVKYLWKNSGSNGAYSVWRGSAQFCYLTACFVPFCQKIKECVTTSNVDNWHKFHDLIPVMANVMKTTVAEYVSLEQIDKLLELYRANGLLREQRAAIRKIEMAVVSAGCGDMKMCKEYAAQARSVMLKNIDLFPEFHASDKFNTPKVSIDGGKVAKFL